MGQRRLRGYLQVDDDRARFLVTGDNHLRVGPSSTSTSTTRRFSPDPVHPRQEQTDAEYNPFVPYDGTFQETVESALVEENDREVADEGKRDEDPR